MEKLQSYNVSEKLIGLISILVICCFLVIVAGLRPPGFDPDYMDYLYTLDTKPDEFNYLQFEPLYWLLVYLNQILFSGSSYSFFFIFALLYVSISVYAIKKYSSNFFLSFLIFIFIFYPNFGLIQIRNGVAIAIFWLALHDFIEGRIKLYFFKCFLASLFHYSLIISFFLIFLRKQKFNKIFYIFLPIVSILIGELLLTPDKILLWSYYLPTFLQFKIQAYINLVLSGTDNSLTKINIINLKSLSYFIIYYLSLLINAKHKFFEAKQVIYLKLFGFGIFIWFAFNIIPVFSFRFSEIFFSILVFLIPDLIKRFNFFSKILVVQITLLYILFLSLNIYVRHDLFDWNAFRNFLI
ncbi:MAG: EpsG family protein [Acidobacterium ailaaui]|nr:EpsG family protein [Pseudacidobacterium ailaaui]